MEITLSLSLPRDARTIAVARHLCRKTLREMGVEDGCVSDIEIALTEACTNVLDHSAGHEYDVELALTERDCVIRVIDGGFGFDVDAPRKATDTEAESGRGISLMHALVDQVRFESRPEEGTVVHLEKSLVYKEGAPGASLVLRGTEPG